MSRFSETMKRIRYEKHMTQEEFAKLLGTSKQNISRYESGAVSPKITTAQNIANKLGITLSEINGQDVLDAPTDGERLGNYMTFYGDTPESLGACLGISADAVHMIILDMVDATPEQRRLICQRYHADESKLFRGTDDETEEYMADPLRRKLYFLARYGHHEEVEMACNLLKAAKFPVFQ